MDRQKDEFTPIQRQMLEILNDGRPHKKSELHECCKPSDERAVWHFVLRLRKKLNPKGLDIVCVARGYARFYQMVRLIGPDHE